MNAESHTDVVKAYDGSFIKSLPLLSGAEVETALERARAQHKAMPHGLPVRDRIDILNKLIVLMRAEADQLALTIALEGGKPLADAKVETNRAITGVELAISELLHLSGTEIPMGLDAASAGRLAFTTKEPIGVAVAVSAFNHPLNLIIHQVIPAVAVGCPVIVKPAMATPLSCLRLVELLYQAGLPEAWCQACICSNEVAETLISDPRVAFFSFIGSARVGWYLRSKLSPGTRCALEHGGVAPVIIAKDADMEAALPKLVKGSYYHAGQVCVSVQRVFVDNALKDQFAEAFAEKVAALVTDDPVLPETEVGPLINPREVARVGAWVDQAVDTGATCLVGGRRLSERVYAPTLLLDPSPDADVSTKEIFGPVACVYGFDEVDHAVERANSLSVAFQAAVFSKDVKTSVQTARNLNATAVMINDHSAFRVDWMPFAGRKTSGLGIGGIGYTMDDLSEDKMIVLNYS